MVGRRLLPVVLGALLVVVGAAAPALGAGCGAEQAWTGGCVDGTLTDDGADLSGTQPGAGGGGSSGGGGGAGGSSSSGGQTDAPPPAPLCAINYVPGCQDWEIIDLTPTLSDIAHFPATPNVNHMEPDGWFITGLDANFYATGGQTTVSGTLLGQPAEVRFTPIRWRWTYGDGATATLSTRGGTWAALGIPEFDPTPTSHVYTRPGTYFIDLTVGYRAEYRYNGGSWGTIDGTLWLPSNRLVATVGGAKTVLVDRDCTLAPTGPGCRTTS